MLSQQNPSDEAKDQAIVAVINWREADKVALANKKDRDAGRTEYKQRNNLRDAADKLVGEP